jgi:2-C-methyl-D-erythritol 4-phosphate cytidylyltransferase
VTWAIVLAAGRGTRFGDAAKQFELLRGRSLVAWSVETAASVCDGVVVVLPDGWETSDEAPPAADAVVVGGPTRSASVRNGLRAVPDEADVIVIHDAARPLAPAALYTSVVDAVRSGADAAVPALPVTDTVKRVRDRVVVETLDRSALVAVQTPQAFAAPMLRRAHAAEAEATDDAALVEQLGGRVVVVAGDARALKVTVPDDLARAEAML